MTPGPGNDDASFEDGILTLVKKEDMKVKLFGSSFSLDNRLKFDSREQEAGTICEHQIEGIEFGFEEGQQQKIIVPRDGIRFRFSILICSVAVRYDLYEDDVHASL